MYFATAYFNKSHQKKVFAETSCKTNFLGIWVAFPKKSYLKQDFHWSVRLTLIYLDDLDIFLQEKRKGFKY